MFDTSQDVVFETEVKTKLTISGCGTFESSETVCNTISLTTTDLKSFNKSNLHNSIATAIEEQKWYNIYNGSLTPKHLELLKVLNEKGISLFYLNGGGGSGKTVFLKTLFLALGCDLKKGGITVTPTGKAADVLKLHGFDARTLHSFIGWQTSENRAEYDKLLNSKYKKTFGELINDPSSEFYKLMAAAFEDKKFFCIDEVSMVNRDQYEVLMAIRDRFLGADAITILSGDFMQLLPVSTKECPTLPSGSKIETAMYRGKLHVIDFDTRYRSIQPEMNTLCTKLRNGVLQDEDEFYKACEYLSTIKILPKLDKSNAGLFADYTFITPTNPVRKSINKIFFEHFSGDTYTVKEKCFSKKGPNPKIATNIRNNMLFEQKLEFKIGMHVMFCSNDSQGKFANGEHGIITSVTLDKIDGSIKSIFVEKEKENNETETLEVFRKDFKEDLLEKMEGYDVHYQQFPLILAHAMTIHKSQGSGYKKLIIDLESIDEMTRTSDEARMERFRFFYTALTRTEDTDHLYFYGIDDTFFDVKKNTFRFERLYYYYMCIPDYARITFNSGINTNTSAVDTSF